MVVNKEGVQRPQRNHNDCKSHSLITTSVPSRQAVSGGVDLCERLQKPARDRTALQRGTDMLAASV